MLLYHDVGQSASGKKNQLIDDHLVRLVIEREFDA